MRAPAPVLTMNSYLTRLGNCENQDFSLSKALAPFGMMVEPKLCDGYLMGYFIESLAGHLEDRFSAIDRKFWPVSINDVLEAAAELDYECIAE